MEKNLDEWTQQEAQDELAECDSLVARARATGQVFEPDPTFVVALVSRSQEGDPITDRKTYRNYGCPLSAMLSRIETEKGDK
jgi:hypothetical protein